MCASDIMVVAVYPNVTKKKTKNNALSAFEDFDGVTN